MIDFGKNEVWEWIKSVLVAVILALVIRAFLIEVFLVQGQSMLPTLRDRERLVVSKIQYYFRQPLPGEIVVFKATDERDFIKRVIAVAGDEVRIESEGVYVNGELIEEPYVLQNASDIFGPVTIPEGSVFVMGDNRNNSLDSRHPSVGLVSLARLKGKAMVVFWPLENVRIIQHR